MYGSHHKNLVRDSPEALCIHLGQDTLSSAKYVFNPEDIKTSRHD